MIDLHTHSIFSDGELIPSELIRRAKVCGYEAIAITDHADRSNYDFIIPRIVTVCRFLNEHSGIQVLPGIELTHVPPQDIYSLVGEARRLGAHIIVVHGETIVEPVAPGTNKSALEADIDILAHPGLISEQDVRRAADRGICLEISSRKGHCLANGHVARLAVAYGARLVLNTDTHSPDDLLTDAMARAVVSGCGLPERYYDTMIENSRNLISKYYS